METVEVTASREKIRREIQTFVHQLTRLEGEFVGRWGLVCLPDGGRCLGRAGAVHPEPHHRSAEHGSQEEAEA